MNDRRAFLALGAGVVSAAAAPVLAEAPAVVDPAAEAHAARAAVTERLHAQRDAWNRGDLEAFCADYDDDAVFLSPSGLTRGRRDVLARYLKKYGTAKETMGTLSFDEIDVEEGRDVVTMAMRWKLVWKDKTPAEGLTLITWVKKRDRWVLAQDASM